MRISDTYSRAHRAFVDAAAEFDLTPMHVRVLVELYDASGGPLTTLDFEYRMIVEGSAIRRTVALLVEDGSVDYRAVDGGRPRTGLRSQLTLLPPGTLVAEFFYARFAELAEGMVPADA